MLAPSHVILAISRNPKLFQDLRQVRKLLWHFIYSLGKDAIAWQRPHRQSFSKAFRANEASVLRGIEGALRKVGNARSALQTHPHQQLSR